MSYPNRNVDDYSILRKIITPTKVFYVKVSIVKIQHRFASPLHKTIPEYCYDISRLVQDYSEIEKKTRNIHRAFLPSELAVHIYLL